MENNEDYPDLNLLIVNAPENEAPANVTVSSPYEKYTHDLLVFDSEILHLPSSQAHIGNERNAKGIRVSSDLPVSIYGISIGRLSIGTYTALPNNILGHEYIVVTYEANTFRQWAGSQFLIIAVENNTAIELVVTGHVTYIGNFYSAGSRISLTLNSLDSVQFQSRSDLTGSKITSSKSVSVFSGNKCDTVPNDLPFCDHMISQVPPLNLWGNVYITTPLATRTAGDVFRVLASENDTNITISGLSSPQTLNSGQFLEINVPSNQSWLISADAPILVAQFCKGYDADSVGGDPSMIILPSSDQFINGLYKIVIYDDLQTDDERFFINIAVDCSVRSTFSSAPQILVSWLNTTQHLGLCIGTAELRVGSYLISYPEGMRYLVLVYALGYHFSYGHPMAMKFYDQGYPKYF